jgi:hypothetical protein
VLLANVVRIIESRMIIWTGHVTRIEAKKSAYRIFWLERRKEGDRWENLGIDGRIVLNGF